MAMDLRCPYPSLCCSKTPDIGFQAFHRRLPELRRKIRAKVLPHRIHMIRLETGDSSRARKQLIHPLKDCSQCRIVPSPDATPVGIAVEPLLK